MSLFQPKPTARARANMAAKPQGTATPSSPHPTPPMVQNTNTAPAIVPVQHDDGAGHHQGVGPGGVPYRTADDEAADLRSFMVRHLTQWAELVELMRHPTPVWVRPSDRVAFTSGVVSNAAGVNARPIPIVSPHPEGARITITNVGPAVLYVRSSREKALGVTLDPASNPQDAWPIPINGSLNVETRDGLIGFVYGPGATTSWAAMLESFEL